MIREQEAVLKFHQMTQLPIRQKPEFEIGSEWQDRIDLIDEEFTELLTAVDIYERADALGDLLYVVLGAAIVTGIDLQPIFKEIQRSNMSKLWTWDEIKTSHFNSSTMYYVEKQLHPSQVRRYIVKDQDNNKALKSPSYSPANLKPIIDQQIANGNTNVLSYNLPSENNPCSQNLDQSGPTVS